MKKLEIIPIAVVIGLVFSVGAMAQGLSKEGYKAAEDRIAAEYKSDKGNCDSLSGNAKDVCVVQAKGKENIAKANLEATYEPTAKHHYQALTAKAEADYAVAKEKCDAKSGNEKDVCVKEAKAVETSAKADAEKQMKTTQANQTASEKSGAAANNAREERAAARQEATTDKLDANYAVAKEKCDALEGDAKARCRADAKAKYGQ
jgi:hypothetical protein